MWGHTRRRGASLSLLNTLFVRYPRYQSPQIKMIHTSNTFSKHHTLEKFDFLGIKLEIAHRRARRQDKGLKVGVSSAFWKTINVPRGFRVRLAIRPFLYSKNNCECLLQRVHCRPSYVKDVLIMKSVFERFIMLMCGRPSEWWTKGKGWRELTQHQKTPRGSREMRLRCKTGFRARPSKRKQLRSRFEAMCKVRR